MHAAPPVLFVVGQPAAAAYLSPLWKRWLNGPGQPAWRVVIHPSARGTIDQLGLSDLPELAVDGDVLDDAALSDWRPASVLVSASGKDSEAHALRLARSLDIPARQFMDTSYDYGRRVPPVDGSFPDAILVISRAAQDEAISEGLPREFLQVIGHPGWEAIGDLPPADPGVVLFASQPFSVESGWAARVGYTEKTTWATVYSAARERPDLFRQLVWAAHPRETEPPDLPPDVELVANTRDGLKKAGTVIGMFSSLLVEAALAGRRVISVQPGARGADMCDLSRHGLVPRAQTVDELIAAMEAPGGDILTFRNILAGSCDRLDTLLNDKVSR